MFGWKFQGSYIARYIFASSSHTAVTVTIPKIMFNVITRQRYESRLVKSKNEIKFERLIYFQLLNFLWFTPRAFCFRLVVCFEISGEWWRRFNEFRLRLIWMFFGIFIFKVLRFKLLPGIVSFNKFVNIQKN